MNCYKKTDVYVYLNLKNTLLLYLQHPFEEFSDDNGPRSIPLFWAEMY